MPSTVNAISPGWVRTAMDVKTVGRDAAAAVQAGFVWINEVSKHFLGTPFGGFKQSGIGREECFEELLAYTQEKNIHVRLRPAKS